MEYKYCRNCKYRCRCCSSTQYIRCSGCENHYDEFVPASWIIYCPQLGISLIELKNKE